MRCAAVSGDRNSACFGDGANDVVVQQRKLHGGRSVPRRVAHRPGLQAIAQYERVQRRLSARLLHDRNTGARLSRRWPHGDDALRDDQAQRLLMRTTACVQYRPVHSLHQTDEQLSTLHSLRSDFFAVKFLYDIKLQTLCWDIVGFGTPVCFCPIVIRERAKPCCVHLFQRYRSLNCSERWLIRIGSLTLEFTAESLFELRLLSEYQCKIN